MERSNSYPPNFDMRKVNPPHEDLSDEDIERMEERSQEDYSE